MARILLIEPNRNLAKQYWTVLEQAGHEVIICLNGQMAIGAADEQTPDIIILELQLKKHNGIEFLYEFRSYPEWQSVPVIVHSMVPQENLQGAAALPLLKLVNYLYKPASSLKKLVQAVDEALAKQYETAR
jgi:DNA-binding response OmpR family regulator